MSYRLKGITNWPERFEQASWSVQELAIQCGVCVRTLETYFQDVWGESPRARMNRVRQQRALKMLRRTFTVQEVANALAYQSQQAFSRAFLNYYGKPPSCHAEITKARRQKAEIAHSDTNLRV